MRAALSVGSWPGSAFFDARDDGFAGGGQFVDAVAAVDDEGALGAESGESAAHEQNAAGREHADDLDAGVRRVGERTAEIEDGAEAEGAAQGAELHHGRVIERREEKHEAGFAETLDRKFGRKIDGDAESFEHVGGAAAGGDGAVAVLGDAGAGGRGYQGSAAGDVEGERTAAAGAHAIDQLGALFVGERDGDALLAHDVDEAGQLRGLLAARGEDSEQRGGLDFRRLAGQDLAQDRGGLFARELCAVFGQRPQKISHQAHISIYQWSEVPGLR